MEQCDLNNPWYLLFLVIILHFDQTLCLLAVNPSDQEKLRLEVRINIFTELILRFKWRGGGSSDRRVHPLQPAEFRGLPESRMRRGHSELNSFIYYSILVAFTVNVSVDVTTVTLKRCYHVKEVSASGIITTNILEIAFLL